MIRLLDRYVLGIFASAFAVFFTALTCLFVTVDFASKLGSFLELRNVSVPLFIGRYYLCRLPMFLTYLLPAVVLFAAMFTVVKLARTNEILPVAASGTSLRRLSAPFLAAAVLVGAAVAALEEYALPELRDEIVETDEVRASREVSWGVEDYDGWTRLWGHQYDHVRREIRRVQITRLDEAARPVEIVTAQRCRWDAGRKRWVAFEGEIEYPGEFETPPGGRARPRRVPLGPEGYVVPAPFAPETLRKSASFLNRLPFAPLGQLLEEARRYPHVPSCGVKVHMRLTFPLSPLLLLLVGLPAVVRAHSKSFLNGLFFCFMLALGYYLAYFACLDLGNRGKLPPAAAAWGPTAAFGLGGLVSFARMRT